MWSVNWNTYNFFSHLDCFVKIEECAIVKCYEYAGNGHPMTCLCRQWGEAEIWLFRCRRSWVVSTMLQLPYSLAKSGTHCTGSWLGLGTVLDGQRKFRPHQNSIAGRPTCSESLYQLSYTRLMSRTVTKCWEKDREAWIDRDLFVLLAKFEETKDSHKNYKVIIVEVAKAQHASCCAVPFIPERDDKGDDSGTCTLDGVLRTYNTASAMSLGFKLGSLLNSSSGSNDLAPVRNSSVSTKPGLMLWGGKKNTGFFTVYQIRYLCPRHLYVLHSTELNSVSDFSFFFISNFISILGNV